MAHYEFETAPQLNPELTFSTLDPEERELVLAVAGWSNPSRYTHLIRELNGRSIEFQSPSRPPGSVEKYFDAEYDGLQIIGTGGFTSLPRPGLYTDDLLAKHISPVDPRNHAEELADLTQLQRFDESGKLTLKQRPYVPNRGMDKSEATNRKYMSNFFHEALQQFHAIGHTSFIQVPVLAAEGTYPQMNDLEGNPLWFQVYRVPLLKRFPTQFLRAAPDNEQRTLLEQCSFLIGKTFRMLHRNSIAYMDGHNGNMSMMKIADKAKLYITDLGSMRALVEDEYPNRYKAVDFYMFFESFEQLFTMDHSLLQQLNIAKNEREDYINFMKTLAHISFVGGYFDSERQQTQGKPGSFELSVALILYTFFKELPYQQYFEAMDAFLTKACIPGHVGIPIYVGNVTKAH